MSKVIKPRVFLSHASGDKKFVEELAGDLRVFNFDVWFDTWAISVGDSIVEKIYEGLEESDILIVVLSPNSVKSKWVKEELSVITMRKMSERNIRIMPVLKEECEIPTPLRHLRYADFRNSRKEALSHLIESLAPNYLMWQALSLSYDHFCLICDSLVEEEFNMEASGKLLTIHSLLESSLNLRTEIEFRRVEKKIDEMDFFKKVDKLVDKGIDVRSQTWGAVVHFRAGMLHRMNNEKAVLQCFVSDLQKQEGSKSQKQAIITGMDRLKKVMYRLCFEDQPLQELGIRLPT